MTEVNLQVNDKEIPLNDLMEEMLINILMGYIKSAKGIPKEITNIKIDINV
ncbi:MAG: hypothetical protein GF353_30080 [Candidatus Lokiarchaeota archaeon]|nr:hypothetical protein [Candidatus Lokiarchaeota archaeon]